MAAGPAGRGAALTGATGRYLITGLRSGRYLIRYQDCRPGNEYLPASYGPLGGAAPVLVAGALPVTLRPVTLLPAGPAARLRLARAAEQVTRTALARIALARTGKSAGISGVARDAAGHGVPGVCVSAEQFTANSVTGWSTITGPRGRYRFPVPPGPWQVSFSSGCGRTPGYAPQWWKYSDTPGHARTLHVTRTGGYTGIDARLQPGAAIAGVVHAGSSTGPGLPGVCVLTIGTGAMSGINQMAVTGANGAYQVMGLGTGDYQVQFQPGCGSRGNYVGSGYPGQVRAADGKTTGGIDGYLPAGATITGTVTAAATGQPVGRFCVLVSDSQGDAGAAVTSAAGTYRVTGLVRGSYQVQFVGCGNSGSYAPQFYNDSATPAGATSVAVVAGQTVSGIDAALQPGGTITGTVTSAAGQPLSGVCVVAQTAEQAGGLGTRGIVSQLGESPNIFQPVTSTVNGTYQVPDLAPGNYQVGFAGGCGHGSMAYAPRWYAPQGGALPDLVSVVGGTVTSGVSITLPAAAVFSGVVRNSRGAGISGLCVVPFPLTGFVEFDLLAPTAMTGGKGQFRVRGIAGGRYKVYFAPCLGGSGYAARWYGGAGDESSGRTIRVTGGNLTTNINQVLTPGEPVTGRVTAAATGKPVAGICVFAVDPSGNALSAAFDNGNGRYRIRPIAAGRFRIEYLPCGFGQRKLAWYYGPRVQVGTRSAVSGVNAALPQAGTIAGTVLAGSPAAGQPGICVEEAPVTGHGLARVVVTAAGGRYSLGGLAPGTYQVLFTPNCLLGAGDFVPQWYSGAASQAPAATVRVTAGATTSGIGGTLSADGGISGTVTVGGAPVAGVCAIGYPAHGGQPVVGITGATGAYQMAGLAPGRYLVEFAAGCGDASYATQWYDGASSRSGATPVSVTSGAVTSGINAS